MHLPQQLVDAARIGGIGLDTPGVFKAKRTYKVLDHEKHPPTSTKSVRRGSTNYAVLRKQEAYV